MSEFDKDDGGGIATLIDEDLPLAVEGDNGSDEIFGLPVKSDERNQIPRMSVAQQRERMVRVINFIKKKFEDYPQSHGEDVDVLVYEEFADVGEEEFTELSHRIRVVLQEWIPVAFEKNRKKEMSAISSKARSTPQSTQRPITVPLISVPLRESPSSAQSLPHSPEHVQALAFLQLSRILKGLRKP